MSNTTSVEVYDIHKLQALLIDSGKLDLRIIELEALIGIKSPVLSHAAASPSRASLASDWTKVVDYLLDLKAEYTVLLCEIQNERQNILGWIQENVQASLQGIFEMRLINGLDFYEIGQLYGYRNGKTVRAMYIRELGEIQKLDTNVN